ncbi:response regulator [Asticcacaulis sp. AC402]|uniref:response regulator n=1 Tax=Asticcacaulis sp. AC402 TaxID=1282361 RepID=UPI0012DFC88E|nr:response regulator [Asticcacaulis sp. AC402]
MAEFVPDVMASKASQIAQVLFVEDSTEEIRLVTALLNRARVQFDGHWVTSAEDALKFLRHEPGFEAAPRPDLIFLDLNLPKIQGGGFLKTLAGVPGLMTIPVVVLSGSDLADDIVQARQQGVVHYLVKPLNYEKLCEAVARVRSLKLVARGDELILCAEDLWQV